MELAHHCFASWNAYFCFQLVNWIFFVGIHYRIITTAISDVSSAKEAKTIRYYNTLGTESSHPFKGINIMVTTHTDGTTTAKKILHYPPHTPHTNPS